METTRSPHGVPTSDGPGGMTPHHKSQLMTPESGWHWLTDDSGSATVVYLEKRENGSRTLYMPWGTVDVTGKQYRESFQPRLTPVHGAPTAWSDGLSRKWGDRSAIERLLARINQRTDAAISGTRPNGPTR